MIHFAYFTGNKLSSTITLLPLAFAIPSPQILRFPSASLRIDSFVSLYTLVVSLNKVCKTTFEELISDLVKIARRWHFRGLTLPRLHQYDVG